MNKKPLILISSCLLGNNVRFDGGHKRDNWVINELAKFVDFIAICPEVQMGLGTPRATLRIIEDSRGIKRLVRNRDDDDLTSLIIKTSQDIIEGLPNIDGVILTHKSPSCGVKTTKVYDESSGRQLRKENGFFTNELIKRFGNIPIIDSGLINDDFLKENFIRSLFCLYRFKQVEPSVGAIQSFHKDLKYLLMEYNQLAVSELGAIAANSNKKLDPEELKKIYFEKLSEVLIQNSPSVKKRVNVFSHLFGYFKKDLSCEEKNHILERIKKYSLGHISYSSLVELFSLMVVMKKKEYLCNQILLSPFPKELMQLKNFV